MRFFSLCWFCFDMTRVIKIVLFTIRLQDDQQPAIILIMQIHSESLSFFAFVRSRFRSLLRAYADKMLEKTIFETFFMGFCVAFLLHRVVFRLVSCFLILTHGHARTHTHPIN